MKNPSIIRAFQWDLARQVERLDVLLELLPKYAEWGYQELYLHLEDAVEYPSFPDIARPDAYSQKQLARLVEAAHRCGIGVVPIVNLLGHTQYLIKTNSLRELNELRAPDGSPLERGQICPLHPRTPRVAERLLHDIAPFCSAGKVHVGLDESFHLGRCPACRAEIEQMGLAAHFAGHVRRLEEITRARGLKLGIWADMLNFVPEAVPLLPSGLAAYDWYYYPFRTTPKVEFFNFAASDLAPAFRAQGISYWGCPMNGAFRYEPLPVFGDRLANIRSWWNRCRKTGAAGMLVTSWEAYRLAFEMCTVVDAAAADLWLIPDGEHSDETMLAHGFERLFGKARAKVSAQAALAADRYPFAGYACWETNERWDIVSPADEPTAIRQCKWFRRLLGKSTVQPLEASLGFRRYLAERDAFLQSAAAGVGRLRKLNRSKKSTQYRRHHSSLLREAKAFGPLLAEGRRCARAMWRRTRNPRLHGQNEAILDADSARLHAWQRWLRSTANHPEKADDASPVFGRWQLQFVVLNFAPAVQRVVVSRQNASGVWEELRARHTIEFQSTGARSRTAIRRAFAVPVTSPRDVLEISVQGVGQVAIETPFLTDGVDRIPSTTGRKVVLGNRAPRSGFPDVFRKPGPTESLLLKFEHPSS